MVDITVIDVVDMVGTLRLETIKYQVGTPLTLTTHFKVMLRIMKEMNTYTL